ncbi:MAG: PLDc N-terminal domain-containing protein [Flavisolibacter sp.]
MISINKYHLHPNFLLGAFSFLALLLGVVLRSDDFMFGEYLKLAGIGLGAIHWTWSIIDVFTNHGLNGKSRMFWIILVMLIPPVGGMIYYLNRRMNVGI